MYKGTNYKDCFHKCLLKAQQYIGGCDGYIQIHKMHSDLKIPGLKSCIKSLALKLYDFYSI